MGISLVWAPLIIGTVISGVLLMLALMALVTSNSRWDDHLINAVGWFLAALIVSLTLRLTVNVFRPKPGVSRQWRVIHVLLFAALVLFIGLAAWVTWLLSNMSFL